VICCCVKRNDAGLLFASSLLARFLFFFSLPGTIPDVTNMIGRLSSSNCNSVQKHVTYSTFLFHHLATLSRLLSRPPESRWSIYTRRPFIRSLIHFEFPATFELHISSQKIELFQSHKQLTSNVCLMSLDTIHAGCVILTILLYWGSRGPAAKKDQLLTSH
jgi:hypothetical protein